jgi:hypothetical protein
MLQQLLMNTYLIWGNKNTTPLYLPSQSDEGIYNGVYYTTDVVNIINEVTMQKHNALNILNNRPKFEAIVSECDNILNSINQSPSAPSKPAPGFEEFRQYMDQRISTQETLLQRIAQELGLDINLNNSKNYAK